MKKIITKLIKIIFIVLLILIFIKYPSSVHGSTLLIENSVIIVDINGDGDYLSISNAINNSKYGDEIYICPGEYYENITINHELSLIGTNVNDVIIIGDLSVPIIDINADNCNIINITLLGFNNGIIYNDFSFVGIRINSSNNYINKCIFHETIYNGILIEQKTNNIINNCIFNNTYGIINSNSNELIISNNAFNENQCGIDFDFLINSKIKNNIFTDCYRGINILDSNDLNISCNFFSKGWNDISIISSNRIMIYENCIEEGNQGIQLSDYSKYCMVLNNQLECGRYSIRSLDSDNNQILNNTCNGGSIGIDFSHSDWNIVNYNIIKGQSYYGIDLKSSENNQICYNLIQDVESNGISVSFNWDLSYNECMKRGNNNISHNHIESNGIGISLRRTGYIELKNNSLINCGLFYVGNCYINRNEMQIEKSNTINGDPVYFFKGLSKINIPMDAAQIKLLECSDIIIDNRTFDYSPSPIVLRTCDRIIIRNNTMNKVMNGIELDNSNNNTMINNKIYGILNQYSFSLHRSGIDISTSNDNVISNNTIMNVKSAGVGLFRSDRNLIEYNYINNGQSVGMEIHTNSNFNTIQYNTILNNADYGMELSNANYNTIMFNDFSNNSLVYTHRQVDIFESDHSHDNLFINNSGTFMHGYHFFDEDESFSIKWSEVSNIKIDEIIKMLLALLLFSIPLTMFIKHFRYYYDNKYQKENKRKSLLIKLNYGIPFLLSIFCIIMGFATLKIRYMNDSTVHTEAIIADIICYIILLSLLVKHVINGYNFEFQLLNINVWTSFTIGWAIADNYLWSDLVVVMVGEALISGIVGCILFIIFKTIIKRYKKKRGTLKKYLENERIFPIISDVIQEFNIEEEEKKPYDPSPKDKSYKLYTPPTDVKLVYWKRLSIGINIIAPTIGFFIFMFTIINFGDLSIFCFATFIILLIQCVGFYYTYIYFSYVREKTILLSLIPGLLYIMLIGWIMLIIGGFF